MPPLNTLLTLLMQLLNTTFMLILPILAIIVVLLWIPTLLVAFLLN